MTTWIQIVELARRAGAKFPELVAAQWALESGYGSSPSGKNNFFGIKGTGTKRQTKEFVSGRWVTVTEEFQDFETPDDCVKYLVDRWHRDFKSYKGVNNAANRYAAARDLVRQGYATDPNYAEKLIKIMDEHPQSTTTPTLKMIGPNRRPQDFGFKAGDTHLIVNDISEKATAWSFDGKKLWEVNCLARGQGSDTEYRYTNTDTPPGLYHIGTVYNDYVVHGANPAYDRTLMAYGWVSFDLVEMERQEAKYGRAGIMIHGGGSANGWPGAWEPRQRLVPTHGCVRMYNEDLLYKLLPLTKQGTVFVSVYQEG